MVVVVVPTRESLSLVSGPRVDKAVALLLQEQSSRRRQQSVQDSPLLRLRQFQGKRAGWT
jgi:hypothetical protein